MNIAWSTAAILALLLPGFFFIRGIGFAEPFSRDATPRSPIALLALAVLISILVHALSIALLGSMPVPRPDVEAALLIASGQLTTDAHLAKAAAALRPHLLWIMLYFLATSMVSVAAGWSLGIAARSRPAFGRLIFEHEWLHAIHGMDTPSVVYALTNIAHEGGLLMYHGKLDRFGIRQDGRFSFVVLRNASRGILKSSPEERRLRFKPMTDGPQAQAVLYLDGESIANLYLDPPPVPPAVSDEKFREQALEKIRAGSPGSPERLGG